jgi:hypothetical protein
VSSSFFLFYLQLTTRSQLLYEPWQSTVEEDDAGAVPLAGVRVPHEGERAAVEWFRDGVSGLARAPLNIGEWRFFYSSAQQPKAPAAKSTGGEGGRARVGPLYALLFFFSLTLLGFHC